MGGLQNGGNLTQETADCFLFLTNSQFWFLPGSLPNLNGQVHSFLSLSENNSRVPMSTLKRLLLFVILLVLDGFCSHFVSLLRPFFVVYLSLFRVSVVFLYLCFFVSISGWFYIPVVILCPSVVILCIFVFVFLLSLCISFWSLCDSLQSFFPV